VKVAEISPRKLFRGLRKDGVNLRIGPFVVRVQSPINAVAEGIRILYASYPIVTNSLFADFHVRVAPPKSLRRWIRPQVIFFLDDFTPFKPLPLNQAFAFFEWGLNWCVAKHANQYLILHAAVVEKGGNAVIMAAPPETGKSTLCAGLVANGWRLLSDELALIGSEDGSLTPIPRPVSLKNESIDVIRDHIPGVTIGPESVDTTKGVVAHMRVPEDSIARVDEPARPAWFVCPRYEEGAVARLEGRSKAQTLMYIIENAFNYSVLGVQGFRTASSIIDACDCYDFTYSRLEEAMEIFDGLKPPRAAIKG
jgi:HprK-related kinase A